MSIASRARLSLLYRTSRYRWRLQSALAANQCPVCSGDSSGRGAYGRRFRECGLCGFIWCHDFSESVALYGMGLEGSWGGPERGGERDDYMVRFLNEDAVRQRVLIYGAGTTLVFRVLLDDGFDVIGADVSDEVVNYRKQEFGDRFIHTAALESRGGEYDIITACEVFEHFHHPARWISALASNLTPDGVLCGSTNFYSGTGPIEDPTDYMSAECHVAYWSETSLAEALRPHGLTVELFELVCPGSVKPDLMYNRLVPNKRLFFASRDEAFIDRLRVLKASTPILPCDTSDYPVAAYRSAELTGAA
jgi:SAM-dependent methyltransferase